MHALTLLGFNVELFCPRSDAAFVERAALNHLGLPVIWFDTMEDQELIQALDAFEPDCVLSVIFNQRIPDVILNRARLGSLNVHPAPLPAFRTASPWFWPIRMGLSESEICVHHMTRTLDEGPVVLRDRFELSPHETQGTYAAKLNKAAPALMKRVHELLLAPPLPAGETQVNGGYFPPVQEADLYIDFSLTTAEVDALVRACNPYHPARTLFRGRDLGIHEAVNHPGEAGEPGTLDVEDGDLLVNCRDGQLRITAVNRPGEGIFSGQRFAALYQVLSRETFDSPTISD